MPLSTPLNKIRNSQSEIRNMQVINPANEEIIKTITEDSKEIINAKYQAARKAQPEWKQVELKQRIAAIQKFSDLLETNKESLALTLTSEMGKPLQQARNEINGARGRIKFFTENAEKHLKEEWLQQDAGMIFLHGIILT
jgi:acyl-CoA reductase-like NAD-dependent aldehyde dehydrogenase